jgi:4-amino-4-deoxy-L-arabinose transferase-like glycosyltransferase
MRIINNIKLPLLILLSSTIVASLFFPFFPKDETRYLAVAWEMKLAHSFVPLLNGLPYSHKPPFLFALINLDWLVFGANEQTLRLIPLFFSLLNILMTYKIALVLWDDKKIAKYATAILSSMLIYIFWSTLIMFDLILTFWVLVGIYGFVSVKKNNIKTSLILVAISIGGGLLTKGPVVFAYILPIAILYFLWRPKDKTDAKRWYLMILLSILMGLALALLWAIPAAITGGEAYGKAILWGQTTGRMVSSFAHQRPIWWYIPIIPILFFPWVLVKPAWHGFSLIKHDESYRFLAVLVLTTITVFSLISGKQIHYLIPILPAVSLLFAKNIVTYEKQFCEYSKSHYPIAIFYAILGSLALLGMPFIQHYSISKMVMPIIAVVLILCGTGLFFIKPLSMDKMIKIIAISSMFIFVMTFGLAGYYKYFNMYDVSNIAHMLKEKQSKGYTIIHYKDYHGQYQFLGRLTQPLVALNDKKSIVEYVQTHKKVLLVTHEKKEKIIHKDTILYQQPYKDEKIVLWNEKGIQHFLKL